jgi:pimeloyl-ACP methyl ester carboxylesterase
MTNRENKRPLPRRAESHSRLPVLGAVAAVALAASALAVRQRTRTAEEQNPPIGTFLEVDGVKLHYLDSGSRGPAIVLLHGNGAMVQDLVISGLVAKLSRRYRVIAFDRPGYGYSTRPRDREWTPEAQADLFYRAIRELGLERPIIFGHSWGTLPALAMALRYPLHVSGVAVASGYYFPTARADVVLFSPPAIPVVGGLMRHTVAPFIGDMIAPAAIRKMFAPQPVSDAFMELFPLGLALRPEQIRASSEEAAMMVQAAARFSGDYGKIQLPLTIIAGAADAIVDPQRQAMKLHRMVPHSRLMLVSEAGHMVHHFATGDIAAAIDELHRDHAAAPHGSPRSRTKLHEDPPLPEPARQPSAP